MLKSFSVFINKKTQNFNKKILVDKDKSCTHRALLLASQGVGKSTIKGLISDDIITTVEALKTLGIKVIRKNNKFIVYGCGIGGFKKINRLINLGGSGSTLRMLLGLLSTFPYKIKLTGDSSLKRRPVRTKYVKDIGANVYFKKEERLPLIIHGTSLPLAKTHTMEIPSAQLKSQILFGALSTPGITEVVEKIPTRNHLEIMLKEKIGNRIKIRKNKKLTKTSIKGFSQFDSFNIDVSSDPSSAAFFVIQTLLSKNAKLRISNVYINKTRIGFIYLLKKMGGKISIINKKTNFGEPVGDIVCESSFLKNINYNSSVVPAPYLIDEFPAIFCAAALSNGISYFKDISELAFKESNRILSVSKILKEFNIKTKYSKNSLKIYGNSNIKINKKIIIPRMMDHRVCMSAFVLASVTGSNVIIKGFETVNSSFPTFLKLQKKIGTKFKIL